MLQLPAPEWMDAVKQGLQALLSQIDYVQAGGKLLVLMQAVIFVK